MRVGRMLVRFSRLGWRRQLMLVEALGAVAAASLAVRFLPFERAVRMGALPLFNPSRTDHAHACRQARWSVVAVATRVPWRAVCFQRGLALQRMLRRRGIDALLHYGIGFSPDADLAAHVWVEVDGAILLGGEDALAFKSVVAYP